jgi:hypothetical protein
VDEGAATADALADNDGRSLWQRAGALLSRHVELEAAILLSIATVLTAWCAYQAARWSGLENRQVTSAMDARIESSSAFQLGMQELAIDSDVFLRYAEAFSSNDVELMEFLVTRAMRPEFLPFFEDWRSSDPLNNPDAARNPLDDEEYLEATFGRSAVLEEQATAQFEEAEDSGETADQYTLSTVLFASVLFFAGISTKLTSLRLTQLMLALGVVMLVVGVVQFGIQPTH